MKKIFGFFLLVLCLSANSQDVAAVTFTDIKFGTKQFGDAQWNASACINTTTCSSSAQNVGSMRNGNGQNFTLGSTQYLKFSYTNTDPAEPWTITAYNANGTVAAVLGTYRIITAGQGYFMTSNQPHPNAGNGTLWSTQIGMVSGPVTFTGTLQPTQEQMNTLASAYYSPDPIYTAGQTYVPPSNLCCGGSSAPFNTSATHQMKINNFVNRTIPDSQVHIEQIGNSNTIVVQQTGTTNNYTEYNGNGSFNTVNITQSGNNSTQANYIELGINGNSNTVNLTQTSTGGTKSIFATVNDNSNTLTVQQKDSGSHYANVILSGGNKNVDILQQGSAGHKASVDLSGTPTNLNLSQSGSTQQFYSITHTCSTAGGCGTISVQQGQ